MGLFDTLTLKHTCPLCDEEHEKLQTKDLDRLMQKMTAEGVHHEIHVLPKEMVEERRMEYAHAKEKAELAFGPLNGLYLNEVSEDVFDLEEWAGRWRGVLEERRLEDGVTVYDLITPIPNQYRWIRAYNGCVNRKGFYEMKVFISEAGTIDGWEVLDHRLDEEE